MKADEKTLRFFLGAYTPQGFVSQFDQLANTEDGWKTVLLKGGPGTGKSTILSKIAAHLGKKKEPLELIHSPSQVDTLEALILPKRKISIADGTPPHAVEPQYPGAVETVVDLSACCDNELLYQCRGEILPLTDSYTRCHTHCCRYLNAAHSLMGDTYRIALDCLNTDKLSGYCGRLADKEFKTKLSPAGKERVRFLSAVTDKGIHAFTETVQSLCERVYLINDELGAVSRFLLFAVRSKAMESGYDVISCYCPLGPYNKLEHLLIPALGLGFVTSNRFHDFDADFNPWRIVNCKRFSDNEALKEHKKRIQINRKSAAQMVAQSKGLLQDAKKIRAELSSYYIHAVDYAQVDAITTGIIASLG